MSDSQLFDLAERLRSKATVLDDLVDDSGLPPTMSEHVRLRGKAEGVRLALSFVEKLIRQEDPTPN